MAAFYLRFGCVLGSKIFRFNNLEKIFSYFIRLFRDGIESPLAMRSAKPNEAKPSRRFC